MRNMLKVFLIGLVSVALLAACGDTSNNNDAANNATNANNANETESGEKLQIVTTFTLLEDIVDEVAGDLVETHNLVPLGTDPHEYEPLPEDIAVTTDADIIIANGMNLEGGDSGWLAKLIESTNQEEENIYIAADDIEPMYLTSEDGTEKEVNPHIFLDPINGIKMAENIHKALVKNDPDNTDVYDENLAAYLVQLDAVDQLYEQKINEIPEENRVLVTSERAYQYMAKRYGLDEGYIWAIDTEEGGTPEQITRAVNFVNDKQPPVLFVESNVDTRPMETVSNETGVEIYPEAIYADELGTEGSEGETFISLLEYNIHTIFDGLSAE